MMFSTFSANPRSTDSPTQTSTAVRPKRSQVARACDWCRLNRLKCDDRHPCDNCRRRGCQCSNGKPTDAYSSQTANREIQRLRNRVRDLQAQLKKANEDAKPTAPKESSSSVSTASGPTDSANPGRNGYNSWEGVPDLNERTGRCMYYGPLSSTYLVSRMVRYLCQALSTSTLDFPCPALISQIGGAPTIPDHSPEESEVTDLSRAQEEHFLVLLWQSFHCIYPVISEAEFRAYYESLWSSSSPTGQGGGRGSSALVDSLLAVCIQYGSTFLVDEGDYVSSDQSASTLTMAHSFHIRSQRLLMSELEAPSIASLQSHIYGIIYLLNASLLNSAHANLGVAIRTAQTLRLHLRQLADAPPEEKELNLRIWWSLYQLDTSVSMALDRPPFLDWDDIPCPLPSDHEGAAAVGSLSGMNLLSSAHEQVSWLSFHVQHVQLTAVARRVHAAFKAECARLLCPIEARDIHDEPAIAESLAGFLAREARAMYDWVQTVPQSLKTERKGTREPFSTDRAPLKMDPTAPLWLQRQRLLLEVDYHHFQIATFRSFIQFPPRASSTTLLCDGHNISCLNHAMMLTNMLHQVLSETDILRGWLPVVQYQWDAMMCILAFVLANPVCPPTPAGRRCLQTAIQTLDLMGQQYVAARDAAYIGREIVRRVEMLVEQFRRNIIPSRRLQPTPPSQTPEDSDSMMPLSLMPSVISGLTGSVLAEEHWQTLTATVPLDFPESSGLDNELPGRSIITPPSDVISSEIFLPDDALLGADWIASGSVGFKHVMDSFMPSSSSADKSS